MAVRELTPIELGNRLKRARRYAGIGSRRLALDVGGHKQLVSNIEQGLKKEVDFNLLVRFATHLAGKGELANRTPDEILDFLEGRVDVSVDMQASKGYWLHAPSHLGFSPSQTEPGCPGDSIPVRENKFAFAS